MLELTIKVKDEKTCLVDRDTIYEPLNMSFEDSALKARVEAVVKRFLENSGTGESSESPTVVLKVTMIWQS